jgi:hypothetical protein
MVFQILLTCLGTCIANEVLYGVTCPLSTTRSKGAVIINVIQSGSTFLAVFGCFQFEVKFKKELKTQKGMLKLLTFKPAVALEAIQTFVFPILADNENIFFPSPPYEIS